MATSALCGYSGSVTGPGATEVTQWEITQTQEAVEATSFESAGWKERVACLKGATGSFRSVGSSSEVGLHTGCSFKDNAAGYTISGSIVINQITVDTPVDGIVSFTHTFSFTGNITAS